MTTTKLMVLPVVFQTSVCYCGPERFPVWSGYATMLGHTIANVWESDGCRTESAVIESLSSQVRSYRRTV